MADGDDDKKVETGNISPEAQAEIDALKEKLRVEEAARAAAEAKANGAAHVAASATAQVDDANLQIVSSAISEIKTAQTALKAKYAEALSSQDYAAAAEIQEEMGANSAKLLTLESGKQAMEEEKKNPRREQPIIVGDPAEDLAKSLDGSWPKSAAWIRKHPEYVRNERLRRKMVRAHEDAIDDGVVTDTPAYFEYVEKRLGIQSAGAASETAGDAGDGSDSALSVAAGGKGREANDRPAPSLPAGNRGGAPKGQVRLTQEQKDAAAASGISEEEYAKNLTTLKTEGRIH